MKILKFSPLFLLATLVTGCASSVDIPEDIYNFLHSIEFDNTFLNVNSGKINFSYSEIDASGSINGEKKETLIFSKTSQNQDFYFCYEASFSGNQIDSKTKITSTKVELKEVNDNYVVETTNNGSLTSEQIPYDQAYLMMNSIFFTGDSPFRYGGLYYGDYFQANSHKYGNRYILEDSNLTFKIEDDKTMFEGATCNQEITIDDYGMLIFCEEEVVIDRTQNRAVYNINGIYNQ